MEDKIMKRIIRYCGVIAFTASLFFLRPPYTQAESESTAGYVKHTYEIHFPQNLLKKVLLHSGYSLNSTSGYGTLISDAKITLNNQKLGKTSAVGEIQVVADDIIKFIAKEKLRFLPNSKGTSITFGEIASSNDDNSAFIVYTGRWLNFFGLRICNGQVFNIPGESQCI